MKFGVVVFPGSNCDQDITDGITHFLRQDCIKLWHKNTDLEGCDVIVLPGGFSYGDYLRSGAIARFSPIMNEVVRFANKGGIVVGICNGFQIATEAGLLPGALLPNTQQKFLCKNVYIKPTHTQSRFTNAMQTNKSYQIPIAHAEGRYYVDDNTLKDMQDNGQILFQYCDVQGKVSEEVNPNGSLLNIAGVCNKKGNVMGMMPHPERALDPDAHNTDGIYIFESLLRNLG
ncbi:MAG: phosphoribosylformylglycinamidine synthase subunit PurQ [Bacteroidia bacterium]|nr:phosphoribosylformylglycinamidine synthase subunit PurQ [Bacteroidia bacterium]MDW8346463.1 phosphoribosylformylglycinamidine synthase subunit PurQ [Bacteroidia bacterium]